MLNRIATALIVLLAVAGAGQPAWAQQKLGPQFHVNTTTAYSQSNSALASRGGGGFAVVWESRQDLSEKTTVLRH
jgi:hypothetical protein